MTEFMINSRKVNMDELLRTIVIYDMMWHNDVSIMWHISFISHSLVIM